VNLETFFELQRKRIACGDTTSESAIQRARFGRVKGDPPIKDYRPSRREDWETNWWSADRIRKAYRELRMIYD